MNHQAVRNKMQARQTPAQFPELDSPARRVFQISNYRSVDPGTEAVGMRVCDERDEEKRENSESEAEGA